MERKTVGGFIAALRKANGMTQKELAERLNVSDKTVSRWECDEGAPDLSVIPVIAEIFGVTCDELLRGERRSPEERQQDGTDSAPGTSQKGEKERRRILKAGVAQFKNNTCIAMGISVLGLIAAMICNLAFLQAVLGFFVGAIFFAAAIVCETVFLNRALLRADEEEFHGCPDLNEYKREAIRLTEYAVGLTVALIGFTFPLALLDAFVGLGTDSMLLFGLIGAGVFLILYAAVCYFVNGALIGRGVYTLPEKEAAIRKTNHALLKKYGIRFLAVWGVTMVLYLSVAEILGPYDLAPYTEFTDYDSFVAYMETEESRVYHAGSATTQQEPVTPVPGQTFYDQYGNEITEEEAFTETLTDKDGNILCRYVRRNDNVAQIRFGNKDGLLPLRVSTYPDIETGRRRMNLIHMAFGLLCFTEAAVTVYLYVKKRAK